MTHYLIGISIYMTLLGVGALGIRQIEKWLERRSKGTDWQGRMAHTPSSQLHAGHAHLVSDASHDKIAHL